MTLQAVMQAMLTRLSELYTFKNLRLDLNIVCAQGTTES
jgi:hypothetical protein